MQQLIEINNSKIGGKEVQTVNARNLHAGLEVGKDFSNWIKAQIKRARLQQNIDFVTVAQKGVGGKFDSIDYHLTIEAGKHVAMMCGTDKGFEVRDYFIECERRLLAPSNAIAIEAYKAAHEILLTVPGLDQALAAACTLRCIQEATGASMEGMRMLLPPLETSVPSMNATAVGERLNVSPRVANAMLSDAGLQFRNARGELELTPEGRKYGRLLPFNNKGHSGYQILWMPEVVDQVRRAA